MSRNMLSPEKSEESEEEALLAQAREAAQRAYCPYSNFPVGAAVRSELGVTTGCNVENASYGLALCAERVALFAAVAQGARQIRQLAVACIGFDADAEGPAGGRMPCGACRQVMTELMPPDAMVLIDGVGAMRVMDLLPAAFRLAQTPFLDLNG
jgi:cytidine deaminase